MKFLITGLLLFSSFKLFAIDFKNYEDYKKNNALLASDLERLESMDRVKPNSLYAETITQYKTLLVNYDRVNSPLSLESFALDASENGWRATAAKAKSLVTVCEGSDIFRSKCIYNLKQLKLFVSGSNLNLESKESITSFINNYISESTLLSVFDEKFIGSFNQNSKLVNEAVAAARAVPAMTIKITPVTKIATVVPVAVPDIVKSNNEYYYFSGALLFFIMALAFYNKNKKVKRVQRFYGQIFQVAYTAKLKLKLFGFIEPKSFSVVKKIEATYLDTIEAFQSFQSLAPEIHVKFKTQNEMVKIETFLFSHHSILGFVEKEAEVLGRKLELLQQAVSACGGELIYSNHLNIKGEITNSNIVINLPTN
jgi:hypothetical protein